LGSIGSEELEVIIPVINEQKDCIVEGPFVSDAYFGNRLFKNYDMTIGMYHDQLLVPFKLLNFERGVNFTAGLPIVRTSPDHGTAFDIAWKNQASETSMVSAFNWARKIVKQRRLNAK
jgi:4-hydroxythreonine-4-phosphate dehydrogenase